MDFPEIITQCYNCKRVITKRGQWSDKTIVFEHISLANHTLCEDCKIQLQQNLDVKYILKELLQRILKIFPDCSAICFSDDITIKNLILSNFVNNNLNIQLYEHRELAALYSAIQKSDLSKNKFILLFDIRVNEDFEFIDEIREKFTGVILFVPEDLKNNFFKFTKSFNIDFVIKPFIAEELAHKIYNLLLMQETMQQANAKIEKLQITIDELNEKIQIKEKIDTETDFWNFNAFFELIFREYKRMKLFNYSMIFVYLTLKLKKTETNITVLEKFFKLNYANLIKLFGETLKNNLKSKDNILIRLDITNFLIIFANNIKTNIETNILPKILKELADNIELSPKFEFEYYITEYSADVSINKIIDDYMLQNFKMFFKN